MVTGSPLADSCAVMMSVCVGVAETSIYLTGDDPLSCDAEKSYGSAQADGKRSLHPGMKLVGRGG